MLENLSRSLLPSVKEIIIGEKKIKRPESLCLRFSSNCCKNIQNAAIEYFNKKIPDIKIDTSGIPVDFTINPKAIKEGNEEGYSIDLNSEKVCVVANGEVGLYYGALTLGLLLKEKQHLFELKINDWPSIKMRMFHLDLKRIPLDFEYLKRMIAELAERKINSVLIEYEDKFPFGKHPDIQVDSAMTQEQIRDLIVFCKSHYIEPIPLVQSYGHLEYILTKDNYKDLREDPIGLNEICGSNSEAKELIFSMMEEVIKAHPGLKYFHIGGDEPFRVRFCRKCQEIIDNKGKGELYLQHIRPIIEFLQKKEIVPIIWDDMLITHPEIADKLPKPLIINYWNYSACKDTGKDVLVRGIGALNIENALDHPDTDKITIYKKYWQCDKFPKEAKTLPLVKYYQDLGYEVIGAGASRTSASSLLDMNKRAENMRVFSHRISENGALGILSTSWASSNSLDTPTEHWEYFWHPQLASAEYAWTGGQIGKEDFTDKFLTHFFGVSNQELSDFINADSEEKIIQAPSLAKSISRIKPLKETERFELFKNYIRRLTFQYEFYNLFADDFMKIAKYPDDAILNIDIAPFANRGFVDKGNNPGWSNEGINDMMEFPVGKNILGGVPFEINEPDENNRAIICMNNVNDQDNLPKEIYGIPVNAKCRIINFLHTLSKTFTRPGELIGRYIIKFKDGDDISVKIIKNENISGWWCSNSKNQSITVWRGKNRKAASSNVQLGVSLFQWKNPHPEREIESIAIQTEEKTTWLVLAINAVKSNAGEVQVSDEWNSLKKNLKSLKDNFDECWKAEKTSLKNFISQELIDFYEQELALPLSKNIESAMIS